MRARRASVLMLFYPFTTALLAAGFLAFVMLVAGIHPLLTSVAMLWFLFACWMVIYALSRPALRALGFNRLFLGLTITTGLLAAALSASVLITGHG